MPLIANLTDLEQNRELLRSARYGVIEFENGVLRRVQLHWPKLSSLFESWWSQTFGSHRRIANGRCRLFYNEPRSCPGFLALPYLESDRNATMATVQGALKVLDEIARLKSAQAIVCEVANQRISERLLQRQGWVRHLPHSPRRHYIKRFSQQPAQGEGGAIFSDSVSLAAPSPTVLVSPDASDCNESAC